MRMVEMSRVQNQIGLCVNLTVNRTEISNDREEHYSDSRDRDKNSKKDRYVDRDSGRGQNVRDSRRGQKDERENRDIGLGTGKGIVEMVMMNSLVNS